MRYDIIITRHQGLIEFLEEKGITSKEVIAHVSDTSLLKGKNVIGVLPVALAELCDTFTEVKLNIPAEMRGKELSKEYVEKYFIGIYTYKVTLLKKVL